MPKIGEPAPDFELPNQDGKMVKLSDYRGQKVILFAYPKADTPGCTTQACGMRDNFPKYQEANTVVLGISADEPKANKKFKQKYDLPYDLLSDVDHQVLEAWDAWGEKSIFGRKFQGVIRSHWVIDENGVVADTQVGVSPQDSIDLAFKTATVNWNMGQS
jgi:peroxiredoxin Q/BCP